MKDAVFFCGRQRLDVLPDALRDAAISTSEYTVYDTEPVRHILDNSYDGILFYSPLAVKTFFLDNDILPETVVFALGTTTSAAIRAFLKRDARLAPAPEKSALLRSAIDYFTLQKIQGT